LAGGVGSLIALKTAAEMAAEPLNRTLGRPPFSWLQGAAAKPGMTTDITCPGRRASAPGEGKPAATLSRLD
jgi:hypothetical protein